MPRSYKCRAMRLDQGPEFATGMMNDYRQSRQWCQGYPEGNVSCSPLRFPFLGEKKMRRLAHSQARVRLPEKFPVKQSREVWERGLHGIMKCCKTAREYKPAQWGKC
jgi:hypothetical protein